MRYHAKIRLNLVGEPSTSSDSSFGWSLHQRYWRLVLPRLGPNVGILLHAMPQGYLFFVFQLQHLSSFQGESNPPTALQLASCFQAFHPTTLVTYPCYLYLYHPFFYPYLIGYKNQPTAILGSGGSRLSSHSFHQAVRCMAKCKNNKQVYKTHI